MAFLTGLLGMNQTRLEEQCWPTSRASYSQTLGTKSSAEMTSHMIAVCHITSTEMAQDSAPIQNISRVNNYCRVDNFILIKSHLFRKYIIILKKEWKLPPPKITVTWRELKWSETIIIIATFKTLICSWKGVRIMLIKYSLIKLIRCRNIILILWIEIRIGIVKRAVLMIIGRELVNRP